MENKNELVPVDASEIDVPLGDWNTAVGLLREWQSVGRKAAMAYVRLGLCLHRIKEAEYFSHGGDRKNQVLTREHLTEDPSDPGALKRWTEDVHEHLGMSRQTADRYIADARRYLDLRAVAAGEVIEVETDQPSGKRLKRRIGEKEEEQQAASQLLLDIETGQTRAARAWAGLAGKTMSGGRGRADVRPAREVIQALGSLERHLPRWDDFTKSEREQIEERWINVQNILPEKLT